MSNLLNTAREAFGQIFGQEPIHMVRAPGRVNLIGEHTDYNGGFVLPAAIDRFIVIALRPNGLGRVRVHSLEFGEQAFDLCDIKKTNDGWIEYLKGVAWALQTHGLETPGWDGVLVGDVPVGAGLSSSAALEMATLQAFAMVGGWSLEPVEMARIGQRTENEWIGVASGIMDQLACAGGKRDHALLIDCANLTTEAVALPSGYNVVVLDTATRRGLAGSAYNERRAQCEAACRVLGIRSLREAGLAQLNAHAGQLDGLILRRARHVVTENERTLRMAEVLRRGDLETAGRLMQESHVSLRDDYQVSCAELDAIVAISMRQPACAGARMTGAGFGGCAVALVARNAIESFCAAVQSEYQQATSLAPNVYVCRAVDGAFTMDIGS